MDQCLLTAPHGLSQFCHVLLRLLVPRHPPNALTSLTTKTVRPAARFAPSSLLERIKTTRIRPPDRTGRRPSQGLLVYNSPSPEEGYPLEIKYPRRYGRRRQLLAEDLVDLGQAIGLPAPDC